MFSPLPLTLQRVERGLKSPYLFGDVYFCKNSCFQFNFISGFPFLLFSGWEEDIVKD